MNNNDKKIRINVYLSKEAIKKFKIMCIEKDQNVSEVINDYVIKTTQEYEKTKQDV